MYVCVCVGKTDLRKKKREVEKNFCSLYRCRKARRTRHVLRPYLRQAVGPLSPAGPGAHASQVVQEGLSASVFMSRKSRALEAFLWFFVKWLRRVNRFA